jgi:hypothetical protein
VSTRKRWATTFPHVPGAPIQKHPSKAAAYRQVQKEELNWRGGMLRSSELKVLVDEGRGWETYERVNLADLSDPF